jgi:hypothetical protein
MKYYSDPESFAKAACIAQMPKKNKEIFFIQKNRLTVIPPLNQVMSLVGND